jgi:hypothetical protein
MCQEQQPRRAGSGLLANAHHGVAEPVAITITAKARPQRSNHFRMSASLLLLLQRLPCRHCLRGRPTLPGFVRFASGKRFPQAAWSTREDSQPFGGGEGVKSLVGWYRRRSGRAATRGGGRHRPALRVAAASSILSRVAPRQVVACQGDNRCAFRQRVMEEGVANATGVERANIQANAHAEVYCLTGIRWHVGRPQGYEGLREVGSRAAGRMGQSL